jgi:ribonuclease P/MRP protein subunit RPP1
MRRFADLHLCPTLERLSPIRLFSRSAELGYDLVGVSLPINVTKKRIQQLRQICFDEGLDIATRVDLEPKSIRELTSILRRIRNKFEIISVKCVSKQVSRQAAKDRRVDIISSMPESEDFFDLAAAKLALDNLSALEVDMSPLLSEWGIRRVHIISNLRKNVRIAKKIKLGIVISSGSTNEYLLRNPRDYAALSTLLDLTPRDGLRAISEVPLDLIQRNRAKLNKDYIAPGIMRKNGFEDV